MADKNSFRITDDDKEWVQENFNWLIKAYGYPDRHYKPVLFTKEFFSEAFTNNEIAIEPLLADLSRLFTLDKQRISFEIEEDIRDTHGTPYEFQGKPFECDLEVISIAEGYSYKLYLAKTLFQHPKRLLFNCAYQFINIRLSEDKIENAHNEDADLFIYLVGIYMGFGVLLAQTMTDEGRQNDGFWETKWTYASDVPVPVMAYAMALYSSLIEEKNPDWKNLLPSEIQTQYNKAAEFIRNSDNTLFNKQSLKTLDLLYESSRQYEQNDFEAAIALLQKAIFLAEEDHLKVSIYNNIGYYYLRKEEFEKSIPNFQKALEINPGFGYASDNLGFAFIMTGDLVSGKYYVEMASQTGNNDEAYSYRNRAIYYQKKKEPQFAKENFEKAFNTMTVPVDLLEYFYANFLFEIGEKEKGLYYLKLAVEKKEPEAIKLMKKI